MTSSQPEETYRAVKWALAGADLSTRALRRVVETSGSLAVEVETTRNRCEAVEQGGELAELFALVLTEIRSLTDDADRAYESTKLIAEECEGNLRAVLTEFENTIVDRRYIGLDEQSDRIAMWVEEIEQLRDRAERDLIALADKLAEDRSLPVAVLTQMDQAVEVMQSLTATVAVARDAVGTLVNNVARSTESAVGA